MSNESPVTQGEIKRLENHLRKTFGCRSLEVRGRAKQRDSAEVYVNNEFIGILFKIIEDGETEFQFQMAILDMDLEDE